MRVSQLKANQHLGKKGNDAKVLMSIPIRNFMKIYQDKYLAPIQFMTNLEMYILKKNSSLSKLLFSLLHVLNNCLCLVNMPVVVKIMFYGLYLLIYSCFWIFIFIKTFLAILLISPFI